MYTIKLNVRLKIMCAHIYLYLYIYIYPKTMIVLMAT